MSIPIGRYTAIVAPVHVTRHPGPSASGWSGLPARTDDDKARV
ncbi:hypothetical protein [Streptomyces umbrinus]|nr:hypothetical protein [Streptomyces umbrinus]